MSYKPNHTYSHSCPPNIFEVSNFSNRDVVHYPESHPYRQENPQSGNIFNQYDGVKNPHAPSESEIENATNNIYAQKHTYSYQVESPQNSRLENSHDQIDISQNYAISKTIPNSSTICTTSTVEDQLRVISSIPERENYELVIDTLALQFQKLSIDISGQYASQSNLFMKQLSLAQDFKKKKQKILKNQMKEEVKLQKSQLHYQKNVLKNVHKLRELNRTYMQKHLQLEDKFTKESH